MLHAALFVADKPEENAAGFAVKARQLVSLVENCCKDSTTIFMPQ